jgi:lipopolysaccharide transport system permease protein
MTGPSVPAKVLSTSSLNPAQARVDSAPVPRLSRVGRRRQLVSDAVVTTKAPMVDVPGLIWTLVRTDFKARYHGTWMGFVWALLKPVAMLLVLMTVFSFVFPQDTSYRLNLIVSLFLWDFFADGTKTGLTSMHSKGYLLAKTRFPKWIVVVTSCSNALLTLLVFSVATLVVLTLAGRPPSLIQVGLYFAYLLALLAIVIGFSLGTSALFLRYRDLNQVWDVLAHAGFFVAPIIYPLSVLPERVHFFLYAWPPTPIIEFSRSVLVQDKVPTLKANAMLGAMALGILLVGMLIFRRFSPGAMERL